MKEVSPEDAPYDEDTQMIGRKYRYKELCWNSKGFSLRDTSHVKICYRQNTEGGHS